jgi:hypothetical protein
MLLGGSMITKIGPEKTEVTAIYLRMLIQQSKTSSAIVSYYDKGDMVEWEGNFKVSISKEAFRQFGDDYLDYIMDLTRQEIAKKINQEDKA